MHSPRPFLSGLFLNEPSQKIINKIDNEMVTLYRPRLMNCKYHPEKIFLDTFEGNLERAVAL